MTRPSRILAVILSTAILPAGCRTLSKGITESVLEAGHAGKWRVRYGSHSHYALTNATLEEVEFDGCVEAEKLRVRYQRGLRSQAECIAERTSTLLEQVQRHIGMTVSTRSTIQLLRLDETPQNFDISLTVEPNEFPLPLFVPTGDESCHAILAHNRSYPYLFVHELVETSMASGETGVRILPDLTWGVFILEGHVNNYTRWFRDGLANYAGYVACKIVSEDLDVSERPPFRDTLLHTRPFSSLALLGKKIFSWRQSSHTPVERRYYSAVLGLFLLIENRFGEDAIRAMVSEVARHDAVDGRDLVNITNQVLGADVKTLVADFEFPRIGLELERMTVARARNAGVEVEEGLLVKSVDAGSRADQAGLQTKDVIVAVNARPIINHLDFELVLFEAQGQASVPLTVHRVDAEPLTVALPLAGHEDREQDQRPPGKRKAPLKRGRVEISGSLPFSLF